MYSDLFDQLGGDRPRSRGGARNRDTPGLGPRPKLRFKAGRFNLEESESKKFHCTADTARGEIRLVWNKSTNVLEWQFYDRRANSVKETTEITTSMTDTYFERIETPNVKDRVYVWYLDNNKYKMYWMQDADDSKDDEIVKEVNEYLSDPAKAAPDRNNATGESDDEDNNNNNAATGAGASTSSNSNQVDALSSILENLGMPQGESGGTSSTGGGGSNTETPRQQLTLADLQGAMAGIQQQQQAGPPFNLQDVVTNEAIEKLLQDDETVQQRLMTLLPETQQTPEQLRENLQSPQVQQTLRALTQALLPDDHGDMSGYASVIANFQLNPQDGEQLLAAGNPIAAFLECIIKSVEKEKQEQDDKDTTTTAAVEGAGDADKMDEDDKDDKGEESKDEAKDNQE